MMKKTLQRVGYARFNMSIFQPSTASLNVWAAALFRPYNGAFGRIYARAGCDKSATIVHPARVNPS
jgi:hypothetical protein